MGRTSNVPISLAIQISCSVDEVGITRTAKYFKQTKDTVRWCCDRARTFSECLSDQQLVQVASGEWDTDDIRILNKCLSSFAGEVLRLRNELKIQKRGADCTGHSRPDMDQYVPSLEGTQP